MSFIRTSVVTAILGLAVASGASFLSLHMNTHRGNGGDQYDVSTSSPLTAAPTATWGRSGRYSGKLSISTDPMAPANESLFAGGNGAALDAWPSD